MSQNIVVDCGSGVLKAGLSSLEKPTFSFQSLVGKYKKKEGSSGGYVIDENTFLIGEDAIAYRDRLVLQYPITHGVIEDWDDIERLWHFAFKRGLHVDPAEHNVLMTNTTLSSNQQKQRMIQTLFELFEVQGAYIADQSVLSLYASGLTSGVSVCTGDGVSSVCPVYEGFIMDHAVRKLNFGGRELTALLVKLLQEHGQSFHSSGEREMVRMFKEKNCFVDYAAPEEISVASPTAVSPQNLHDSVPLMRAILSKHSAEGGGQLSVSSVPAPSRGLYVHVSENDEYSLPDGTTIFADQKLLTTVPEAMFRPIAYLGIEAMGLHECIVSSIQACAIDLRTQLFESIVLTGGNSLYPGFPERLAHEVKQLAVRGTNVQIMAPANRADSTWIGGSILAELPAFQQHWITREQYEEFGPEVVLRQAFTS